MTNKIERKKFLWKIIVGNGINLKLIIVTKTQIKIL